MASSKELMPSFNTINDDILRLVLDYLPMKDRIKVERVCKQWREAVLKSFREMKILQIYTDFGEQDIQLPQLKEIFRRCGENLTYLNLARLYSVKPRCIFTLINKYCKHLEHLMISSLRFQENDLNMLSGKIVKNLKEINMDDCSLEDSEMLSSFLKKAVKLERFTSSGNYFFWGKSLLCLSKTVRYMDISCCSKFYNNELIYNVFANLPNLKDLNISDTHIWAGGLEGVCHQLKSLNMSSMIQFFEDDSFKHLSFENLEHLNASDQCVMEEFIPFIARACPELKILNLYGVYLPDPNPEVYKSFKNLKKLEKLIISGTEVTDEVIEYWMNENLKFKRLECIYCSSITQTGLTKIIEGCSELEFMYFAYKPELDIREFLEAAFKAVELRTNNASLSLRFYTKEKIDDQLTELKSKMETQKESQNSLVNTPIAMDFSVRTFLSTKEEIIYDYTVKLTPKNTEKN